MRRHARQPDVDDGGIELEGHDVALVGAPRVQRGRQRGRQPRHQPVDLRTVPLRRGQELLLRLARRLLGRLGLVRLGLHVALADPQPDEQFLEELHAPLPVEGGAALEVHRQKLLDQPQLLLRRGIGVLGVDADHLEGVEPHVVADVQQGGPEEPVCRRIAHRLNTRLPSPAPRYLDDCCDGPEIRHDSPAALRLRGLQRLQQRVDRPRHAPRKRGQGVVAHGVLELRVRVCQRVQAGLQPPSSVLARVLREHLEQQRGGARPQALVAHCIQDHCNKVG
mmetsp:Transcript_5753/g.14588  ORF Transcript_5753/g.14588 Transcript_5753/m.14588 type:complete len:279 (-) Transcript_5753:312-1148(-)